MAERAFSEVTGLADSLSDYPERYRASEFWDGLREAPVAFWNRLIVYEVEPVQVTILAFYDMRQDFSRLEP